MARNKFDRVLEIVQLEAEKEFARKGGPADWNELRTNKLFWKPFQARLTSLINKEMQLPVTKSTGRAALNAACRTLSGVRKRAPGGGRKPKQQPHVASADEINAINSFLTGGNAKPKRAFGAGIL
jgi:hypothetical protein